MKLTKEVEYAIKWLAVEYKFLEKLHSDLEEIEKEEIEQQEKDLKKDRRVIRYIGRAERKAERDIKDILKDLKKIKEKELEQKELDSLFTELDKLSTEIGIPANELLKQGSLYVGKLKEHLKTIRTEVALEKRYPKKEMRVAVRKEIEGLEIEIEDLERWLAALVGGLKKIEEVVEKMMLKERKEEEERIAQLRRWEIEDRELINFLITHWKGVERMAQAAGENALYLFAGNLPACADAGLIKPEYWDMVVDGIVRMAQAAGKENVNELFMFFLPACAGLITPSSWPRIQEIFIDLVKRHPDLFRSRELIRAWVERSLAGESLEMASLITTHVWQKWGLAPKGDLACPGEVFAYLKPDEVMYLFKFIKNLLDIIKEEQITVIYAIDESGRILGVLLYFVLSRLGLSKGIKCYFINVVSRERVVFYSEKQKEEIRGQNVLLLDEEVVSGETLKVAVNAISKFVGPKGKVIPRVFSAYDVGDYGSVTDKDPSWRRKSYSGFCETPHGAVEIDKATIEFARDVRRALSGLAAFMAECFR